MGAVLTADFDLNNILGSLSSEDIANLGRLAGEILGTNNNAQASAAAKADEPVQSGNASPLPPVSDMVLPDLSVLSRLAPLLSELNRRDERADFIAALKPLLSEERRKKADDAIKIIRLVSVLPLLKEQGLV